MLNRMQCLAISVLWLIFSQAVQALDGTSFITKWQTFNDGDSIEIPINPAYVYNTHIDCDNDGIFEKTSVSDQENMVCTYASAGEHIIAISGDFPALNMDFAAPSRLGYDFVFNPNSARNQLLAVMQWGNIQWQSMTYAFADVNNLQITASDVPILTQVTDMSYMFSGASAMNHDMSAWDVSHVSNMAFMFAGCAQFNQDIGGWNVGNVTNMDGMFHSATAFNQDISGWNVSHVTNMSNLFYSAAAFNQDIRGWDVSNVTNVAGMFNNTAAFNQDIRDWNVSNVTNMAGMFSNATAFNQDIRDWDVSNVTNMASMFSNAAAFNQDISNWNVSNVTSMASMFAESIFNQNINAWNVAQVTNMTGMFMNAKQFNSNISAWDVSNVENMSSMFEGATAFNQEITRWNVGNVTSMRSMFLGATAFNQDLNAWDVAQVTSMVGMFMKARQFNGNVSAWDVSHVTDMSSMFLGAVSFDQDLSRWDIRRVTNMSRMLTGVTLSVNHYDALLQAWSQLAPTANIVFDAGTSRYSNDVTTETARAILINTYFWTITDGGNTAQAVDVMECGQVAGGRSNVIIDSACHNEEWLFNVQVTATGSITGGRLSGTIQNQGLIKDVVLTDAVLEGGTLGGHIRTNFDLELWTGTYDTIKNVTFEAGSVLELGLGGRISGSIIGDSLDPVVLLNAHLFIYELDYLSHAIVADYSSLLLPPEGAIGQGVRFSQTYYVEGSDDTCETIASSLYKGTEPNACFQRSDNWLLVATAPEHRGQTVELVFLATDGTYTYSYDGKFWQGNPLGIENIIAAKSIAALPYMLSVDLPNLEMFNEVFAGYRLDDGEIIYTQVK